MIYLAFRQESENLYLDEYYDYNFEAFYGELLENKKYKGKYDISYSSLNMYFFNDDIISPVAHKETIKLYNEKLNNAFNFLKNIFTKKILTKFGKSFTITINYLVGGNMILSCFKLYTDLYCEDNNFRHF